MLAAMLELALAAAGGLAGFSLALAARPGHPHRLRYAALALASLLAAYLLLPSELADAPGSYFRM